MRLLRGGRRGNRLGRRRGLWTRATWTSGEREAQASDRRQRDRRLNPTPGWVPRPLQGVSQGQRVGRSPPWVEGQRRVDRRGQLGIAPRCSGCQGGCRFTSSHGLERGQGRAREHRLAGHAFVEQGPEGEHVGAGGDARGVLELFGGSVARRAQGLPPGGQAGLVAQLGQAEVRHQRSARREEDVARLEIAVHEATLVQRSQGRTKRAAQGRGLLGAPTTSALQGLPQGSTGDVGEDQRRPPLVTPRRFQGEHPRRPR